MLREARRRLRARAVLAPLLAVALVHCTACARVRDAARGLATNSHRGAASAARPLYPLALRGGQAEAGGGVLADGRDSGGGAECGGAGGGTPDGAAGECDYERVLAGLQDAVVAGIRRGAPRAELARELELRLIRDVAFANASVPDDFATAMRRLAHGCPVASANWTCAACSTSSASHTLACCGCCLQRSLAERVITPEHVRVCVPDDVETMAEALDMAQAGLSREWNAAGRSAHISLRSGSHTWAKELLVLCNMSLCFEGRGFQGCDGGRSAGRWWLLDGYCFLCLCVCVCVVCVCVCVCAFTHIHTHTHTYTHLHTLTHARTHTHTHAHTHTHTHTHTH